MSGDGSYIFMIRRGYSDDDDEEREGVTKLPKKLKRALGSTAE